jgi:hypothetical protein
MKRSMLVLVVALVAVAGLALWPCDAASAQANNPRLQRPWAYGVAPYYQRPWAYGVAPYYRQPPVQYYPYVVPAYPYGYGAYYPYYGGYGAYYPPPYNGYIYPPQVHVWTPYGFRQVQ